MKKEELIAMGLSEEQANAIVEKYGAMIPKERFDGVNNAKKTLEEQVKTYESQLKELQGKAKGNEELQAEITKLQESHKQATEQYEQQLKDERLTTALKLAFTGKVHDVDLVVSLIDKEQIELDEKGNITKGLDEQRKTLQESKSFLFTPETEERTLPKGTKPGEGRSSDKPVSIGAQFAQQANEQSKSTEKTPWD